MRKAMKRQKGSGPKVLFIVAFVLLLVYVIGLLLPLIWGLFVSFIEPSQYTEYIKNPLKFPSSLSFINYVHGFDAFVISTKSGVDVSIWNILLNSFLYAGGCALFSTLTPFIISYLCARYDFKFSKIVYAIVIIVMSVPIVGSLPSEILMAKKVHVYNSILGQYVMKISFLGLYFLVFHAIFKNVPKTYTEAAKIDGASNFRVMLQIIFPFGISTFGIVYLINFINFWNDYQTPMYYLDDYPVVGYSIYYFDNHTNMVRYFDEYGGLHLGYAPQLFAMVLMVAIPIIILAIALNKKLMGNLSEGGIKE